MAHIERFIQSAWQHLQADRHKQAMDSVKKAHAISPESPDVVHLLGLLASRDGQAAIALPLLQKAIDTGGKTPHRLRHMAEALLSAGYAEAALNPLNDAIRAFGQSSDLIGLKSAIEVALEDWHKAEQSAQQAIALNPNQLAWELNLSFAQLIQLNLPDGFKNATARPENLKPGSVCPALSKVQPCTIWLTGEQSVGALFFLRYVPPLVAKGWQFHLEADRKLVPLLQNSPYFLSVKEKNKCPRDGFAINLGDLPVMALQCGIDDIPPPLPLIPDAALVDKYKQALAKLGPAPYIAVTWRGGPKGRKHRAGIRTLEKVIDPGLLGAVLSKTNATIISLQRLPEAEEAQAFSQALGRKPADYSALNNNLSGMLALLSLVDDYFTVSNTNLHLREGLGQSSHVFVNRPFQDWRWQASGDQSVWYPHSKVYRQEKDKSWQPGLAKLGQMLSHGYSATVNLQTKLTGKLNSSPPDTSAAVIQQNAHHTQLINEGWTAVTHNIPESIAKARAVLSANPENARALHLLGWAAVQDLNFEIGLSVLARATQLEPDNGNIWRDYIRVHILLEQADKALSIADTCLHNPNLWGKGVVHYAQGAAYSHLGDDLKALASFEDCIALIPDHLDAASAAGLIRLKLGEGYAGKGFKLNSARIEARNPIHYPYWTCPVLKGEVAGLNVLIARSMGLGDELSYLRYLPYLLHAGVKVTYWCGVKLAPLLARSYAITLVPDTEPIPDPADFDLAFIKNELPIAVEHLGAPEIADSLPLKVDAQKLEKWREWLKQQGDGPYIGISWSAGVTGNIKDGFGYTRLSKKIEPADLANSLSGINATWLSLTRNITKNEIHAFEQTLGSPLIDLAGITDDLDDLLCIQALLDENIGVSNTNMHLRGCLNLGSRVLVSLASRDWRWGVDGDRSTWFKDCIVYRESKTDSWQTTLAKLRDDLVEKYGLAEKQHKPLMVQQDIAPVQAKKIIWVTAGEIKKGEHGYFSPLASAQERVVNVAKLLETKNWPSEYLIESVSELMGGWHDKLPIKGDVVVFSKVFTEHAIRLMHDAKARGAKVILDVFNDFESQPQRALHQQKMMDAADVIVSSPKLKLKWQRLNQPIACYFEDINDELTQDKVDAILHDWLAILENPAKAMTPSPVERKNKAVVNTKRLIWITGGDISNADGRLTSDLASTRYRVIAPLQALEKYGWQSEIIMESVSQKNGAWGSATPQAGDTVIVSKVFTEHALALAHDAKLRGARVVLDLCDNHLNNPKRGPLQKALLNIADKVVTSTQPLNEALTSVGKKADAVISDPVEFKRGEIKFAPGKVLNLLWFGHAVNIDTLSSILPALAQLAGTTPIKLNVVTTLPNGQDDLSKIVPSGLNATYTPWSVSATEAAIADCDIVIIPTLQSDNKNAKSPNRLLEPLWAGRMVVAGRLPSYLHFADSAWVGQDLITGILWCLANPEAVQARIAQGQADITQYFSQEAIASCWQQILERSDAVSVTSTPALKNASSDAHYVFTEAVVVISYYSQRPVEDLHALMASLDAYDPGLSIQIAIVVNADTDYQLPDMVSRHALKVFYRENTGMNLGAWEYGWRQYPDQSLFIFLQDECRIIRNHWAKKIAEELSQPHVGLTGESINQKWNTTWAALSAHPQSKQRAQLYLETLQHWGVHPGDHATHLRSLIFAARGDTLTQMDGFDIGQSYDECIASEIASSKKVEALGLQVTQLMPDHPFHYIAHAEWSGLQRKVKPLDFNTTIAYGNTFHLSDRQYHVKPRHDLFNLIDHTPKRICEIGCADGTNLVALNQLYQQRIANTDLVGVDIAKIEHSQAYDRFTFLHQTAEAFVDTFSGEKFDLILLSDVIEHLYNPWQFMQRLKNHLNAGARVLLSVPNIQNLHYISATISGQFHYAENGLFDVTHIRFFSLETLTELIEAAGYRCVNQGFRPDISLASIQAQVEKQLESQANTTLALHGFNLQLQKEHLPRHFSQQLLMSCTPV